MKTKLFIIVVAFATLNCSAQLTKLTLLMDFDSIKGLNPYGSLISVGTFLYGMTSAGGANNDGTIFKIKPDGTGYLKLLDFNRTNGWNPRGSLFFDGTFLYGMTSSGGANNYGTIFKIKPDGTGYLKLLDFNKTNGAYPNGDLVSDGTFLYGMTSQGGANSDGVIFKIKPDGTGYLKLLDFNTLSIGGTSNGSLLYDGTLLYGMTQGGNAQGSIFKIMPDGTGYTTLHDFGLPGSNDGSTPNGSLISDGTFLYGVTPGGGTNGSGTIFKIMPDGTGYSKLYDFLNVGTGGSNGVDAPHGPLIYDGTFLYGVASGIFGDIFKIKPDGTGYLNIFDFGDPTYPGYPGAYPSGSLISDGTFVYGMTSDIDGNGQSSGTGTIFKCCISPPVTFSQSLTICSGQYQSVGNSIYGQSGKYTTSRYTQSGTYTDTLFTTYKCDSIVTTYLTVLPPLTTSQSFTLCAGQSVTVGSSFYNSSGTYVNQLTTYKGCDSIVYTYLTVLPANTFIRQQTICGLTSTILNASGASTYVWNTSQTTSSITVNPIIPTTFSVTGIDTNGCVSTSSVNIGPNPTANFNYTVNNMTVAFTMFDPTNCTTGGFSWDYGNGMTSTVAQAPFVTYNSSGTYTACLKCNSLPTNCVICANITIPGNYNGTTYTTNITGIVENNAETDVKIYPNPTTGIINIQGYPNPKGGNMQIKITDVLGNSVYSSTLQGGGQTIDLSVEANGVYFISVQTNEGIVNKKIVISH